MAKKEQDQFVVKTEENISSEDNQQSGHLKPQSGEGQPHFNFEKPRFEIELVNDVAGPRLGGTVYQSVNDSTLDDHMNYEPLIETDYDPLDQDSQPYNTSGSSMASPNGSESRTRIHSYRNNNSIDQSAIDEPLSPSHKRKKQLSFGIAKLLRTARSDRGSTSTKKCVRSLPVPKYGCNMSNERSTISSRVSNADDHSFVKKREMSFSESPSIIPEKMRETSIKQADTVGVLTNRNKIFVKNEPESDENFAPNKLFIFDKTAATCDSDGKSRVIHQACMTM